jgi:hypothetical protein
MDSITTPSSSPFSQRISLLYLLGKYLQIDDQIPWSENDRAHVLQKVVYSCARTDAPVDDGINPKRQTN